MRARPEIVAALVIVVSCCGKSKDDEQASRAGEQKTELRRSGAAVPTSKTTGEPAYFAVDGVGVVWLDGRSFRRVFDHPKSFTDLAISPTGALCASGEGKIYRLSGGAAERIGDSSTPGRMSHVTFAPDGAIWAAGDAGVARFDGDNWAKEETATLGPDEVVRDIGVDPTGRVWITSASAVHERQLAGVWKKHADVLEPKGRRYFDEIAFGPSAVVVASTAGLLAYEETDARKSSWTVLDLGRPATLDRVASDPSGRIHAAGYTDLAVLPPKGDAQWYSASAGSFEGRKIETIAADAAGRTWLATDHGLVVIDPNAGPKGRIVQWTPGTIDAIGGVIRKIVVQGAGPPLPAPGPQKLGSVAGRVKREDQPVAGAEIEICVRPTAVGGGTPCAAAPFSKRGKTGADGSFRFRDVPVGPYRFAIQSGGRWTVTFSPCCTGMKPDQVFDVGVVQVRE